MQTVEIVYECFDHTADLGLRVRAADLDSLFSDAASGLFSLLVANLDAAEPVHEKEFRIDGNEHDYLLLDWLDALLYTFQTDRLVFVRFDVQVGPDGLTARCYGEPLDLERHQIDHDVKAITYHGLTVQQTDKGFLAEVIVDI